MYDVVVVGAGSSGAVVAARASEDPDRTVCLVEAGPDYRLEEMPWDLVNSHNNSYEHDWGYEYRPVPAGKSSPLPRGRVVGGSSAVNTTIALRGMPEDYDEWGPAWAWDQVLPAFCRLERDLDFGHRPYHGDAGPISIRRYRDDELAVPQAAFLDAARDLGYPACEDANDPDSWGAGPHPMNKLGRLRISTAIGYLAAARGRPNLTIRAGCDVARIRIAGGRASGVELAGGELIPARVVVVSAGAVATPLLLMRSGVGPRLALETLGVDEIARVEAVGQHLSDHPALSAVCRVKDPSIVDTDQPIVQTILRYSSPEGPRNDLQIEQFTFSRPGAFGIAAVLEEAESRGSVMPGPGGPVIESGFCTSERDARRLAQGFLDALAFTQTRPLRELIDEVVFPRLPLDLDGAIGLVRRLAASGYHPCGTARMAPDGVVDEHGCSHAIEGLVIADASIIPSVPRANTNLTCIMIGEMIGEWLRARPALYGL